MKEKSCDVLVVGAGPVGLSAGLLLQQLGIDTIIVDRRSKINQHPKARNVKVRGAEILRSMGLEESIKAEQFPKEAQRVMWVESFCGEELAQISIKSDILASLSPCEPLGISQARLEEIICDSIDPQRMHYGTELINLTENESELIATLKKESGDLLQINSKYVIAADGARSPVRELLNIPLIDKENLGSFVSIYFKANPYPKAPMRPSAMYFIIGEKGFGRFVQSVNCKDEWLMGFKLTPELTEKKLHHDDKFCRQFICETFEIPDLNVEIFDIGYWEMGIQIAQHFRKGNIFLAGDAAHLLTPAGGYGLQTGLGDVHNLCWKLAGVIKGELSEAILDSYHEERFPVVKSNIEWSKQNQQGYTDILMTAKKGDRKKLQEVVSANWHILNSIEQDIGYSYKNPFFSETFAGSRAPHIWLKCSRGIISSLDLFKDQFILLTDAAGANKKFFPNIAYRRVVIGKNQEYEDIHGEFYEKYGIRPGDSILVRPDGHIYGRHTNDVIAK